VATFDPSAHTVVVNAAVHTLDADGTTAQAVAVRDGRIQAVGTTDDVLALRAPSTEVIDAGGRAVLPAFTDSHVHLRAAALATAYFIDFGAGRPRCLDDVLAQVGARAAVLAPGAWVRGDNYPTELIAEKRLPTRHELDRVAPDRPVLLRGIGNHVVATNSLGLQIAGIDHRTPVPDGGRIERDAQGEPTGVLHERAKLRLDSSRTDTVIPGISETDRVAALTTVMGTLHAAGVAGIHEIVREPDDLGDYLRLREAGGLSVRIRFYPRGLEATTRLEYLTGLGLRSGFGDDWLRLGGVKFSIDGLETARNAATYQPYPGEPDNCGVIRIQEDDLVDAVRDAAEAGLQVAIHAIGPRAVDSALTAFEAVPQRAGRRPLMHRLEHAYMPAGAGQWERIAKLGLLWSTQASFLHAAGEAWRDLERTGSTPWLPLRTARRYGVATQLNSDYPCSPLEPMVGIGCAVTRRSESGWLLPGDEAITVDDALRSMTNTAALDAYGDPGRQGSVEPGKLADLVMLSEDPYRVAPDSLTDIFPVLTMIDGSIAFRKA
jgi:predicted amidohydrolase YtcJ